jgi:hypothetical protein
MNNPFERIIQKLAKPKEGGSDSRTSQLRSEITGNPVDTFKQTFYHYRTIDTPKGIPPIETFRALKKMHGGKILLTNEEMNQIDVIRECAKDEIAKKLKEGVSLAEQEGAKWAQEGVLSDQEVDQILDSNTQIAA